MKFIYQKGFSNEERSEYKVILIRNTLAGISEVVEQLERFDLSLKEENLKLQRRIPEVANAWSWSQLNFKILNNPTSIDHQDKITFIAQIISIWNDPAFQNAWRNLVSGDNGSGIKLHETLFLEYHIPNVSNYFSSNYIPSDGDLLRARQRTTGSSSNEIVVR